MPSDGACQAVVNVELDLHVQRSLHAIVLARIPFGSQWALMMGVSTPSASKILLLPSHTLGQKQS
jgi:hypothetical protein